MGFITPILINNDIAHLFKDKKTQKEICEKLYSAMINGREQTIPISNYCNYIKSVGCSHADFIRVLIVDHNMIDIDREVRKAKKEDKECLIKYLNVFKNKIEDIKEKIKELENE